MGGVVGFEDDGERVVDDADDVARSDAAVFVVGFLLGAARVGLVDARCIESVISSA